MSDPPQQKRKFEREARRIPCELRCEGTDYTGFILDISARGIFVQTTATPADDCQVRLRLRGLEDTEIEVVTRVARRRNTHRSLAALEAGGLGLRLESAPEEYFRFVLAMQAGPGDRVDAPGGDPEEKD